MGGKGGRKRVFSGDSTKLQLIVGKELIGRSILHLVLIFKPMVLQMTTALVNLDAVTVCLFSTVITFLYALDQFSYILFDFTYCISIAALRKEYVYVYVV